MIGMDSYAEQVLRPGDADIHDFSVLETKNLFPDSIPHQSILQSLEISAPSMRGF